LKNYKDISTGVDQIAAEFIKQGVEEFTHIYKLTYSVWNKEVLPEDWKESIIVPFYKKVLKQIVAIIMA